MTHETRRTLLIGAGGLLAFGLFIEAQSASMHGVSLETVDEHYDVAVFLPHLFAFCAIVLSLWPAATETWSASRRRRLHWTLWPIVVVVALFIAGWTMSASVAAFSFALGSFVWSRANARRKSGTRP